MRSYIDSNEGRAAATHREVVAKYQRRQSASARDIEEIPGVLNVERRGIAEEEFGYFCKQYMPAIFTREFSPMHLRAIEKLSEVINHGGMFAYAMPRGTGKTSLAEAACLWGILTGKRRYIALVSATERHAQQSLVNIKRELSTNELILEDWPEVVYPIWALENIAARAMGQLYQGNPTYIVWTGEQLFLPCIPDSKAAGSVIEIRGLTGAIRGMKANLPGGRGSLRPELVILDDPQTDESARSNSQCDTREEIIQGTIMGLSGHEKEIAIAMPCTVMHRGDLAERFLDNEKKPEWNGERHKLVISFPKNEAMWEEYFRRRHNSIKEATKYYSENQVEMDDGAEVTWKECFTVKQISAVQYAMDLKARVGERAFWAEYQNDPLEDISDSEMATADEIANKTTRYLRGDVPENCQHLTAFVDVHKKILFYVVCGWVEDFTGYIVEYGTWPPVKRTYFSMRELDDLLLINYHGKGLDGAIYAGLGDLTEKLLTREWGSTRMKIEKCMIDANWRTALVKEFCRNSSLGTLLLPSHGRFIGADRKPLNEYRNHVGDRSGVNWRIPAPLNRGAGRHVIFDNNYWKSFINTGFLTPPGEKGCLQIHSGKDHRLFADHCTAEYFTETITKGRTVMQWAQRAGHDDNHWFDCLVGCAVGGAVQGCHTIDKIPIKRKKMTVRYF